MRLLDIGANRGDAVIAGLHKGYDVIAVEAAPRIYGELVKNFIYNPRVTPLKFAVSDSNDQLIEFYECVEDGLSTLDKRWLTDKSMPYNGKEFRTISATTCTVDRLADEYGPFDLIKIDVEGAEWSVFRGMTKHQGLLAFEWTINTLDEHVAQLEYLETLGYTEFAPQYIVGHLEEPDHYYQIEEARELATWVDETKDYWMETEWKEWGLRPTADVGMIWVR